MDTSSKRFYVGNHLGSVTDITDSSGSVLGQLAYDPFGRSTQLQGSYAPDFDFCGYYVHSRSGLNLTQHRAYSAGLGRWINRDPIDERGGINLFAYVNNMPIDSADLNGTDNNNGNSCQWGSDPRKQWGYTPDNSSAPAVYGSATLMRSTTWQDTMMGCLNRCILETFGWQTAAQGAAIYLTLPNAPKRLVMEGSSAGTSWLSNLLRSLFPFESPIFLPAPTAKVPLASTRAIGTAIGRWAPWIAIAFSAADAAKFINCAKKCVNGTMDISPNPIEGW